MLAGKLNTKATVQRFTETQDKYGGTVKTYSDYKTTWLSMTSKGGSETKEGKKIVSRHVYTIWMRYDEDMLSTDRFYIRGQTLEINSISKIGARKGYMELIATETLEG